MEPSERMDPRTALERIIVTERELIALKFKNDPNVASVITQLTKDDDLERAMVEGYVQWLAETGADADYDVLSSERYEDAVLPGLHGRGGFPVYIIAKLDAKVRRRTDGALLFIDHKTVADFAGKIMLIAIDEQMLWYDLIELLNNTPLGERSDGAIYNMLRRVKRTSKAKPPFYERHAVQHNRRQIDAFYRQLWGTVRDLLHLEAKLDHGDNHHLVAYPNPQGDCSWSCDFRAVCPLFNDGSRAESMIQNLYTAGDPLAYYYKGEETK